MPPRANTPPWVPESTTLPPESTRIRSASVTVESWWVTKRVVLPSGEECHGFRHFLLRRCVEANRGLIQKNDWRIPQKRTRKGQTAFLPTGQTRAPLSQPGIVAVRQFPDELMGARYDGGVDHLGLSRPGFSQRDILLDAHIENV